MEYATERATASSVKRYSNIPSETAEAPEASKVRDAITSAESIQNDIADVIGALERRLDTVLRPVPPTGLSTANAKQVPEPVCSHVVGRLNILNDGFIGLAARLRELRDRIEV